MFATSSQEAGFVSRELLAEILSQTVTLSLRRRELALELHASRQNSDGGGDTAELAGAESVLSICCIQH